MQWTYLIYADVNFAWVADAVCPCCGYTIKNVWRAFFPDAPATIARDITRRNAETVKLPNFCQNCGEKFGGEVNAKKTHRVH